MFAGGRRIFMVWGDENEAPGSRKRSRTEGRVEKTNDRNGEVNDENEDGAFKKRTEERMRKLNDDNVKLNEKVVKLQDEIAESNAKNDDLSNKYVELVEKYLTEDEVESRGIEVQKALLVRKYKENDSLEKEVKEKDSIIDSLKQKLEDAEAEIEKWREENTIEATHKHFYDILDENKKEEKEKNEKIKKLKEELRELSEGKECEIRQLKQEVAMLGRSLGLISEEKEKLKLNHFEEVKGLKEDFNQLQKEYSSLESLKEEIKEEVGSIEKELAISESYISTLEQTIRLNLQRQRPT